MPKATPIIHALNGGVFSPWMEGRTDIDKYPSSMRRSINFLPAPQGPGIRRSGTAMSIPIYDETKGAFLVPFIFSNDVGQVFQIEFADFIARFHSEAGTLARAPTAVTVAASVGGFLTITSPGHGAAMGEDLVLAGFVFATNLNGAVARITGVAGDVITTNYAFVGAVGSIATATIARIFTIVTPYAYADTPKLRYVGDRDTVYLFCDGYPVYMLVRYGAYDWRLTQVTFSDGPYDNINNGTTYVSIDKTGTAVPVMTSATLPSGVVTSSGDAASADAWHAFDLDPTTVWTSSTNQAGYIQYQFAVAAAIDGYVIEIPSLSANADYTATDLAPSTWLFQGSNDGVTFVTLDAQTNYIVYDNRRSAYFKVQNATAYLYYRLTINGCTRNGPIAPTISRFIMTSRASSTLALTFTAVAGINQDLGFDATDIGRQIRIVGNDGVWRALTISAVTDATHVTALLQSDAFDVLVNTSQWRLGLFSPRTGYPTCGCFYEDRLMMGGMKGYADWLVGSVPGTYTTISQTNAGGDVTDDNGIVVRVNARRLGRIGWISSDSRSLLLGTGAGEWAVASADGQSALTARTAKAHTVTVRGSASVEPINVDNKLLFVQRGGRSLREMSYSFNIDGYQTPSMSLFASHLGVGNFVQIDFAFEPLAIAWLRTETGKLIGFTYNHEENVLGWHEHDLAGGFVESVSVTPATNGRLYLLWMIVRRVINGVTRRFIEWMTPVWDFDSTLDTAWFVDCGVRYQGAPIGTIYGLRHLEGATVTGLADGSTIEPQVVVNGSITLPDEVMASNIVLGLGYDSLFETSRLEAGAGDGSAQGKTKRITGAVLRLWESGGGQYGTRDSDNRIDDDNLDDIEWLTPDTPMDAPPGFFSGDTRSLKFPNVYNQAGSIVVRQDGALALPLNVVAIIPTLLTFDR